MSGEKFQILDIYATIIHVIIRVHYIHYTLYSYCQNYRIRKCIYIVQY